MYFTPHGWPPHEHMPPSPSWRDKYPHASPQTPHTANFSTYLSSGICVWTISLMASLCLPLSASFGRYSNEDVLFHRVHSALVRLNDPRREIDHERVSISSLNFTLSWPVIITVCCFPVINFHLSMLESGNFFRRYFPAGRLVLQDNTCAKRRQIEAASSHTFRCLFSFTRHSRLLLSIRSLNMIAECGG